MHFKIISMQETGLQLSGVSARLFGFSSTLMMELFKPSGIYSQDHIEPIMQQKIMKKIIISTGGTGGHVVPAQVLYQYLRHNSVSIHLVPPCLQVQVFHIPHHRLRLRCSRLSENQRLHEYGQAYKSGPLDGQAHRLESYAGHHAVHVAQRPVARDRPDDDVYVQFHVEPVQPCESLGLSLRDRGERCGAKTGTILVLGHSVCHDNARHVCGFHVAVLAGLGPVALVQMSCVREV